MGPMVGEGPGALLGSPEALRSPNDVSTAGRGKKGRFGVREWEGGGEVAPGPDPWFPYFPAREPYFVILTDPPFEGYYFVLSRPAS